MRSSRYCDVNQSEEGEPGLYTPRRAEVHVLVLHRTRCHRRRSFRNSRVADRPHRPAIAVAPADCRRIVVQLRQPRVAAPPVHVQTVVVGPRQLGQETGVGVAQFADGLQSRHQPGIHQRTAMVRRAERDQAQHLLSAALPVAKRVLLHHRPGDQPAHGMREHEDLLAAEAEVRRRDRTIVERLHRVAQRAAERRDAARRRRIAVHLAGAGAVAEGVWLESAAPGGVALIGTQETFPALVGAAEPVDEQHRQARAHHRRVDLGAVIEACRGEFGRGRQPPAKSPRPRPRNRG